MNLYPGQLRRIADLCEALNKADGLDSPQIENGQLGLQQRIAVVDTDSSEIYGYLSDAVGGAWSFEPVKRKADQ